MSIKSTTVCSGDRNTSISTKANPNTVGFTINGEKIVSLHYADDTTITITQNLKKYTKNYIITRKLVGVRLTTRKLKECGWEIGKID